MFGRVSALGAQARTRTAALRARLSKDSRATLGRRAGRIRLFPAVAIALLAGLGVAFVAYGFLRWTTPVDASKKAAEIDVTRIALTVVAGVGGVVALVIAYRRQRDLEQSRFVERFGAAAAQLGATDVAVRIAGVYAMAGVADESDGLRRQQCIDVLCGYLRLPYTPELGANHQAKHVRKRKVAGDAGEDEDHFEYRQNDREVRATIIRVIADHLRQEAEYRWSESDFDLRTAHLEDVDFSGATFSGVARFNGATFSGTTRFGRATFAGTAWFEDTTFSGTAWFVGVTFSGTSWFENATFASTAQFESATFSGTAWFVGATFSGIARFDDATFANLARFENATFTADAWFGNATFSALARFIGTTFSAVRFGSTTFSSAVLFSRVTFHDAAWFNDVTFASTAQFENATFADLARFEDATFSGAARFGSTTFASDTWFDGVSFASAVSFEKAEFGIGTVSFGRPKRWGPPPPVFDWDPDVSQKPANVLPQDWPPAVIPTM